MDKKLLTDEIIIEELEKDGFMEEPDGTWLLEYIEELQGGKLDKTSDYVDDRHSLKIYSESTYDSYEIFWCTHDERPYISQDGYYYEDYSNWSDRAIDELSSGGDVWIENHIWDNMEYEFNYALEEWWQEVYQELFEEKKDELLDSGDYYEEKKD